MGRRETTVNVPGTPRQPEKGCGGSGEGVEGEWGGGGGVEGECRKYTRHPETAKTGL